MKIRRMRRIVLTCLAGGCLCGGQAMAGTLTGSQASAPATVNLTGEGTLGLAQWGLGIETHFDQKLGGTNRITNFTQITGAVSNAIAQFGDAAVGYSWSDGTPTETTDLTTSGIYVAGLTNGFQFTVAADANTNVLKVYAGAWNAQLHFEATLSDGSAPAYVDESFDDTGAGGAAVFTITFAANSPGQTLTIRIYSVALHDPDGNCTLMAASLGTPSIVTGTLSSSYTLLANGAVVNLTGEGSLDWAHWGLASETDFNHKTGATQQISNISPIG